MYAKLFRIVFFTADAIRLKRTMRMVHSSHNLHSPTTNLCKNKISAKNQEQECEKRTYHKNVNNNFCCQPNTDHVIERATKEKKNHNMIINVNSFNEPKIHECFDQWSRERMFDPNKNTLKHFQNRLLQRFAKQ